MVLTSGTNLQALIDAIPSFVSPKAQIVKVISNSKHAYGLQRAQSANPPISTIIHSLASFRKSHGPGEESIIRKAYDQSLARIVLDSHPHLVILAGFMHILSETFLHALAHGSDPRTVPVINLHPALPGCFDGANAIRRAWEAGPDGTGLVSETGVMIHEVS